MEDGFERGHTLAISQLLLHGDDDGLAGDGQQGIVGVVVRVNTTP